MSHQIEIMRDPTGDVRAMVGELIEEAITLLGAIARQPATDQESAVHEVRKNCKEARSLALMLRPAGGAAKRFDAAVRDAARDLASLRDAQVMVGTLDAVSAATRGRARTAVASVQSRTRIDPPDITIGADDIDHAIARLRDARSELDRWQLDLGFDPLASAIEDAFRLGRRRLALLRSTSDDEHLHEWRKAVKRLWYQVRAVRNAAPSVLGPLTDALDELSELLGLDHDVAALVERLAADPAGFGGDRAVAATIDAARVHQAQLRGRAIRLGCTVFAERPRAFRRRVERYWAVAVELGPEPGRAR